MRLPIWAQTAVVIGVNIAALLGLATALLVQQTKNGASSFLYSSARERVRELGARVEQEFPNRPAAERAAWLAQVQQPWGVTLSVYDDTGTVVAGPELNAPEQVMREIQRGRGGTRPARAGDPRPAPGGPPMFLVKEDSPSRYWIGYHFPMAMTPGNPPVRHTLTVMAPSLLAITVFSDGGPWLAGLLAALLITVCCWFPLIRRWTRSIRAVRAASAEIAEGRFDVQIPVRGGDELGDLAQSVRRMSAQLSQLVNGQTRFLADVAHELCAPLARIQLSAGILAERAEGADAERVQRLESEVERMSALVGELLSFTKGTVRKASAQSIELAPFVTEVVARENGGGADIRTEISEDIEVSADREYLARALGNVVRNAITYAGAAGPIGIRAGRSGRMIHLSVEDCGPGLPEDDLDAVFQPFYRVDRVRTPGAGGSGLGLSIVKNCVEACGGTVSCRNLKKGLEVVMTLPEGAEI